MKKWHQIKDLKCEICDNPIFFLLQRHRKTFGQHGGTYKDSNIANLCPTCHSLVHWIANTGLAALRMQKVVLLKVYSYAQLDKIAQFVSPSHWKRWDQPNINERLAEKYKEQEEA